MIIIIFHAARHFCSLQKISLCNCTHHLYTDHLAVIIVQLLTGFGDPRDLRHFQIARQTVPQNPTKLIIGQLARATLPDRI